MNQATRPRVAIVGFMLESNSFAPVATEADFRRRCYLEGDVIVEEARKSVSSVHMETSGFVRTMDATGPWEPFPVIVTDCEPAGQVEHAFFERTLASMVERLQAHGPVDAVFIANHGAMVSTESSDPDGEMFAQIREVVGEDSPIVVTLDLHANISERMAKASDVIIGYLTNPHVDMYERGEEAAMCMRTLLAGTKAYQVLVRLPLTPPSVTLLSAAGPYADLIDFGQRRRREYAGAILNVSVFGGFVFSDTPENGIAVVVSGRDEVAPAFALANEIAERGWNNRSQFKKTLTSLDDAVVLAGNNDGVSPAIIFSDAGDNPGGGGGGNTTWLLDRLVQAGVHDVLYGSFFDPPLAAQAHALGEGCQFQAVFNREGETEFAKRLSVSARVLALSDGQIVGRRGIYANRKLNLGLCCALGIGENDQIVVIVISERQQTADPMFFEQFDIDVGQSRVVCVKSRGHFRAGFDEWFAPEQVYEIDTVGLTSPVLDRFHWQGLPRPVYPLDQEVKWPLAADTTRTITRR